MMANQNDIVRRLSAVELFARCTRRDLRIVARHGERLAFAAGTDLVRQGEQGDAFFLLLIGTADVVRDGDRVAQLAPGDWFGELALLDPGARAATVTATADGEVLAVTARMFKVLLRELPALSSAMLGALARQVRAAGTTPPSRTFRH